MNESDTVVIVMDMLQEIFGYDKYSDITSEHAIKGTFCDLAIKLEGAVQLLIEVKAIGLELKDTPCQAGGRLRRKSRRRVGRPDQRREVARLQGDLREADGS